MLLSLTYFALSAATGQVVIPGQAPPVCVVGMNAVADSASLLTVDVMHRMTSFWTAFMKESPAIRDTARMRHQKTVAIDIGDQKQLATAAVDMVALAKQYPAVAADLQHAGVTAEQWEAYRNALYAARMLMAAPLTLSNDHALGKNIAFLKAHPQELHALETTGMTFPEKMQLQIMGAPGGGDLTP